MTLKIITLSLRIIIAFLVVFWFVQHPGHVHVEWMGYEITTTMSFVLFGLIVLIFLGALIRWGWQGIVWLVKATFNLHKIFQKDGEAVLAHSFCALEFGNLGESKKLALEAMSLLPDSPIPSIVLLHAAQALKEKKTEQLALTHLKKFDAFIPLALYEEIERALMSHDQKKAYQLIEEARPRGADQGWFLKQEVKFAILAQQWQTALDKLKDAEKKGAFTPEEANHIRAMLWYKLSLQDTFSEKEQLQFLEWAHEKDAQFTLALIPYCELLIRRKDDRAAQTTLEAAWLEGPKWFIAEYYCHTFASSDRPLARLHAMRDLYDLCPDHPVSVLCLIIYCILAKLWAEAERHLAQLPSHAPEALILKAALTKAHKSNDKKVIELLKSAMEKMSIPFKCSACKTSVNAWDFYCSKCGEFDSIYLKHPITFANCLQSIE